MKKVNENIKKIIDFSKKNNPRGYFLDKIFSWNSKSVKPGQLFISIKTKSEATLFFMCCYFVCVY